MNAPVAWHERLFLAEGEVEVLSVSSLFLKWVGVYVGVCVYTHTHTHTHGVLSCERQARVRHLEGPKNPDGLNLGIYVFVYAYTVHMHMYMRRGGMRSWTNCFFC